MNSPGVVSKQLLYCYYINYNNNKLPIICHAVYANQGLTKAESIIVLKGAIIYVEFNSTGEIENFCRLSSESFNIGIDIEPGIFHTFFAVVEDTVLFEVKPGPYEQISDKDFASWAPAEGSESAFEYLRNLLELTTK